MDSVRFGRILGKGARAAAKGLYEAVDAATAPNPNLTQPTQTAPQQAPPQRQTAQAPMQAVVQATTTYTAHKKTVSREAGRLGRSFLTPFARAGHVLWLEVMGSFFTLFAAIFISYACRYRSAFRLTADNADAHRHLLFSVGAATLFGYFAVTSFVRARRREKR